MITRSQEQNLFNLSNDELFENRTNLVEITLKDNFSSFAKDRGFGFAKFCSSNISADIFVSQKVTKSIFNTISSTSLSSSSSFWAEVSCKKEGETYKYRVEDLWPQLDDVISLSKKEHVKEAAISISQFHEQKQAYFDRKLKTDTDAQSEQHIFTYDEFLLPQKQLQLQARLTDIGNPDKGWGKHYTIVYTYAEFYAELWAKQQQLPVLDYNETNLFAPQDYNIDGKDINVKSVIGVGRRKGTQYSSFTDGNEVLLGVYTHTNKLNDDAIGLSIDGVFDPKNYQTVKLALNYLKVNTSPNVCYFSSLYDYFLSQKNKPFKPLGINTSLTLYAASVNAVPLLLKSCSVDDLEDLLKRLITEPNNQLTPIILELIAKDRIELFPHYLADYAIHQTIQKRVVDTVNIERLLEIVTPISQRQQRFILDLLKANETLKEVRCHWHPEETIAEMGVDIYYSDTSSVPTLKAVCSCDPRLKTTFFTYSWKTNETLCYKQDDNICDVQHCGCLLHQYRDYKLGPVVLGKSSCTKYGKKSYDSWQENRAYPYPYRSNLL
ncbi:hypothetical protein AB4238_03480 [Shewanella sp. 10N.286.45.A1]|uniref:hypothetical protein n=1 Tax=Shewanella sp. 10N.286.45.A1 TaxID=3229694 RepID=UPI003551E9B9